MSLTSQDILDLVGQTAGMQGAVQAARMKESGAFGPSGAASSAPEVQQLLDDLAAANTADAAPARETYQTPAAAAPYLPPRDGGLTPSEIAWITTLSDDPAAVPFRDAVDLVRLQRSIDPAKYPGDARLINAVLAPVSELHAENAAQVALRNAQAPLPQVPASALGALARAITTEVPQLQQQEARVRARDRLQHQADIRAQTRQKAIDAAESQLEAVRQARAARTAVTA